MFARTPQARLSGLAVLASAAIAACSLPPFPAGDATSTNARLDSGVRDTPRVTPDALVDGGRADALPRQPDVAVDSDFPDSLPWWTPDGQGVVPDAPQVTPGGPDASLDTTPTPPDAPGVSTDVQPLTRDVSGAFWDAPPVVAPDAPVNIGVDVPGVDVPPVATPDAGVDSAPLVDVTAQVDSSSDVGPLVPLDAQADAGKPVDVPVSTADSSTTVDSAGDASIPPPDAGRDGAPDGQNNAGCQLSPALRLTDKPRPVGGMIVSPPKDGYVYLLGGAVNAGAYADCSDKVLKYSLASDTYTDLGSVLPYPICASDGSG